MFARIVPRSLAVIGLVMLSCVGIVVTSSPARADIVFGPTDRLVINVLKDAANKGAARGLAPAAADATVGAVRFCKGGPVACGVITAGAVVGSVALVATKDQWIPWIEEKMGDNVTTSEVVGNCSATPRQPTSPSAWGATYGQRVAAGWPAENLISMDVMYITVSPEGNNNCFAAYDVKYRCKLDPTTELTMATGTTSVTSSTGTRTMNIGGGSNLCSATGNALVALKLIPVDKAPYGRVKNVYDWVGTGPTTANTEIQCQRPDGTQYTKTRPNSQIAQGYVSSPTCDPGDIPIHTKGEAVGRPGTGWDLDLKPRPSDLANYPTCSGNACLYRVLIDGEVCAEGDYLCMDWTRLQRQSPNRVECYYGPYLVPIKYCLFMERAFEVTRTDEGNKVATDPNTDGDPDTWTDPAPVPKPTPTGTATASPSPSVTSAPTPVTNPTPVPGYCASPYALGPVLPEAAALANNLGPRFAISVVGGYRESDPYPDHPSGRALDFMVYSDHFKGERLATYAHDNAAALGIDYIMWDHKIWSQARSAEGWRAVADRGSPTANHEDHVHITVLQAGSSGPCSTAGDPTGSNQSAECFPSGWGALNPAEWVLKPTKCALTWAFVPDPAALQASFGGVQADWADSTPAKWTDSLASVVTDVSIPSSSCEGPEVHISIPKIGNSGQNGSETPWRPLNACTAPMSTLATVLKTALTAMSVVGGAFACVRVLTAGLSYSGVSSS